jgi:hypothetical protein
MKQFKAYLMEVEFSPNISRQSGEMKREKSWLGKKVPKREPISKMKSGAHVYYSKKIHANGDTEHVYRVSDHENKHIHLVLSTHSKKGHKAEHVIKLVGHADNKTKAHDFYHHIITHHDRMLATDHQSPGGKKVWERLAKKKSVNIHGWDPVKKKPVNIDHRLRPEHEHETHITHKEYGKKYDAILKSKEGNMKAKAKLIKRHEDVLNLHLIAHKK